MTNEQSPIGAHRKPISITSSSLVFHFLFFFFFFLHQRDLQQAFPAPYIGCSSSLVEACLPAFISGSFSCTASSDDCPTWYIETFQQITHRFRRPEQSVKPALAGHLEQVIRCSPGRAGLFGVAFDDRTLGWTDSESGKPPSCQSLMIEPD